MRTAKHCSMLIIVAITYVSLLSTAGFATDIDVTCSSEIAVTMTQNIASGLGSLLKNIEDPKKRVDTIRSFIDPIRFYSDQSGYFYVYDYRYVNIAHATQKELQGKNLGNYKDNKGNFVIQELAAVAKKGGGFVEYYWVKPGEKGEKKKIGYVVPIPNTDYFIGTGVYVP
jgi:signal transduction histidine kinase